MPEQERTLWGMHAGRLGDADSLFLKKGVIAIGWDEMEDSTSIGHTEVRPESHRREGL